MPIRFPDIDRETGLPQKATQGVHTVSQGGKPVLEVKGLTTRFDIQGGLFRGIKGRIHAVQDLSFAIMPEETLALAVEPRVIVADESVSALDVSVKAQVVNLMMELQEKLKLASLFISHDMAVVERISHRVAVMYLGEIVEIGPRQEIFGNPQHSYTKKLLAAVPVADPAQRHRVCGISNDEIISPIPAHRLCASRKAVPASLARPLIYDLGNAFSKYLQDRP